MESATQIFANSVSETDAQHSGTAGHSRDFKLPGTSPGN